MADRPDFSTLGLSDKLLAAVKRKGFEEPTAIQALTIPVMLGDDTDIIAQAQTGTGKTAAFGLPLIDMIDARSKETSAIILVPTRELAIQVAEEIHSLKGDKVIRTAPIYGGQSYDQQLRALKRGVHIVVGTPGRVIDHLNRRTLKLDRIEHLVLDEADEMLNMGFIEDLEEIMKHTSAEKRTLLFSATMPDRIRELARKYMQDHVLLKAKKETLTTSLTEQIYFEVKAADKFEALCRIIDIEDGFYGLVFCRTKNDVDTVAGHLTDRGYDAAAIHGDISQAQRERVLGHFKKQRTNVLIATDVAARGIDVNNLTHVINYSLPYDAESYVHRIGRTGRAGNQGTAVTFITPSEYRRLMAIQKFTKTDIRRSRVPRVKDIINVKKQKIRDDLSANLEGTLDKSWYGWAKNLLEGHDPTEMLAAVLHYCFEEELDPEGYGEVREPGDPKSSRGKKQVDRQGKARLFIGMGKKDKMNPKKIIRLVAGRGAVKSRHIFDVQVMERFSFIEVPFDRAEKVVASFKEKGRKSLVTHAK